MVHKNVQGTLTFFFSRAVLPFNLSLLSSKASSTISLSNTSFFETGFGTKNETCGRWSDAGDSGRRTKSGGRGG